MRVLFVDQYGKTTGRDTLALANLVENDEIKVTVYISDNTEIPLDKSYTVSIKKGFYGVFEGGMINKVNKYMRGLRELKRFVKKNHFDIVHLQWFSLPWIEWIYVLTLKRFSKLIITVHDVIPFDNRPLEMKSLNKIYCEADRLLVHTQKVKEEFDKHYTTNTPINIITQGFCYKPDFRPLNKEIARQKLDIPNDKIVFLYYGTIRASKGLDILFQAIIQAQKNNRHIWLLAAGALHKVDENRYKLLAEEVVKNGSKVQFGFLPFEMEKYYFSAADVLVLPYTEGTQSGVAQLGLMYEKPIIASDIACMDEIAIENVNALRFHAGNVEELTEKILEISKNSQLRNDFSTKSKEIGETVFSLEEKANLVRKAYKKTMDKGENR